MAFISQWNTASSITKDSISSLGIYFPVNSNQKQYWKFHVPLWNLFHNQIQPVALPEIPPPAIGFISQWNSASSISWNSTSSHGIHCPVKSSQQQYQKLHIQTCDIFPSKIQPVAKLEILHPFMAFGHGITGNASSWISLGYESHGWKCNFW